MTAASALIRTVAAPALRAATVSSPQVSVVIPFLDSARFLPGAVESVLRQTFRDWELLLVDGGSRDASARVAADLARVHPGRVRSLRRRGPGVLGITQSRTLGARAARAPLVALLDSDDAWDERFLQARLDAYRRAFGRRPGVVYGPTLFLWETPRARVALQAVPRPGLHEPPGLFAEFLAAGNVRTPATTSSLVHRSILLGAPKVSPAEGRRILEDMTLWFHAALRFPILVDPRPLCWYRQHDASNSARLKARGRLPAERRALRRWLRRHVLASGRPDRRELAALVG